jgi:hypothetical protein
MHAYDTFTSKRAFEDDINITWNQRYSLNREKKLAIALSIFEYVGFGSYYMDEGTTAYSTSEAQWYQLCALTEVDSDA